MNNTKNKLDPNFLSGFVNEEGYQIRKLRDITKVIIPHFKKYPLLIHKKKDSLFFCLKIL